MHIPYSGKVWRIDTFEHLAKVWQINRSTNRLLIVSTNLDVFSLAIIDDLPNLSNLPTIRYNTYACTHML